MRHSILSALAVAVVFAVTLSAVPSHPLSGRWDLVVQTPKGPAPAWLEVRRSGNHALVGQVMALVGSARPIGSITFDEGIFSFAVPPQWEKGDGGLSVQGKLSGDAISGSMTMPDGVVYQWTGQRAPTLRRAKAPAWGSPIQLFNGKDLTGWKAIQGESHWTVVDGILTSTKSGANLVTEQTFDDFKLHVEVRFPKEGNSGVYLRGRYEVQVEDSSGPEPAIDGLGAVYGFLTPNAYVSKGPGEWHAYDITLVGRTVTIAVNGATVIADQVIPGPTGGALDADEGKPGPILLQGDHKPIEYRNIVLTPAK